MKSRLGQIIDAFYPYSPHWLPCLSERSCSSPSVSIHLLPTRHFYKVLSAARTPLPKRLCGQPLLLIGVGICIAYRGNVINIGGEGQMIMGALVGAYIGVTLTNFPGWLNITLGLLGGVVAGAIWGGIPGVLKAYFNVNEILSTVMMNAIAVQFKNYYLTGSLMDPSQADMASKIPQSARLEEIFRLPRLWQPTRLHLGSLIAVILAILVYILLWHTTTGYRIRAVGQNPHAAKYAGVKVKRYIVLALLLSGALAGLAGATQVYGVNYRMITDGSATGFTGALALTELSPPYLVNCIQF